MNKLTFEPLHDLFGARVTGIDLTSPLSDEDIAAIAGAMDQYSLLCFPGQDMTDEAQLALTRRLGEPEPNHVTFGTTGEIDYFATIGNVIDAHRKKGNDDAHTRYQTGNNMWHSDSSFRLVPTKFSINHSYEAPAEGGETQFVSQRVAYASLPASLQAKIDLLHVALHTLPAHAQTHAPAGVLDQIRKGEEVSALRELQSMQDGIPEEFRGRILLRRGHPADTICRAASEGYELVVISTRGRTGLAHVLIGSVAERVVRHAPVPVLVVR